MLRIPLLLLSATGLLAGCGPAAPTAGSGAAAPAPGSAMEFRGERPCADCNGIEAWLRLERRAGKQPYRLVEDYRGEDHDRRYDDEGEWLAEGDLLRLHSRDGGERVYARLADGALQARDAHGQALPAAADDVLVPVAFDAGR